MANLKLLSWFSIACLVFAMAASIADLTVDRHVSDPMMTIMLFVGLLGSYTAQILKTQQKRLEALESKINDPDGHYDA